MEAGLREREYVLGGGEEKQFEDEGEAGYEEDEEGPVDGWRDGLDG